MKHLQPEFTALDDFWSKYSFLLIYKIHVDNAFSSAVEKALKESFF